MGVAHRQQHVTAVPLPPALPGQGQGAFKSLKLPLASLPCRPLPFTALRGGTAARRLPAVVSPQ
jgi:hypothetical protein